MEKNQVKHTLIINPADEETAIVVTTSVDINDYGPEAVVRVWTEEERAVHLSLPLETKEDQEGALKVLTDMERAIRDLKDQVLKLEISNKEE